MKKSKTLNKFDIVIVDLEATPYKFDLWNEFTKDHRVNSIHVFFARPSTAFRNGHNFNILPPSDFSYTICRDDGFFQILNSIILFTKFYFENKPSMCLISGYVDILPFTALFLCFITGSSYGLNSDQLNTSKPKIWELKSYARHLARIMGLWLLKQDNALILTCGKPGLKSAKKLGYRSQLVVDFPYVVERNRLLTSIETPNNNEVICDLSTQQTIILFSGRMIERKGLKTLLMSALKIKDILNWKLWIEGTGALLDQHKSFCEENDLSSRCRFLGASETSVHNWYLSNASIICVPSLSDAWGIVVDEAMQVGKPVISSDCVGSALDRIENGKNGFIFTANNHDELADLLRMLILDPTYRLKIGLQAMTDSEKYSPKRNVDNFFSKLGNC